MKSPVIAAVLNFILPGAGLLYIGRILAAAINLGIAIVVPFAWVAAIKDGFDSVHFVTLAIAAGSAGFAHAMAGRANGPSRPDSPPSGHSPDSSAATST